MSSFIRRVWKKCFFLFNFFPFFIILLLLQLPLSSVNDQVCTWLPGGVQDLSCSVLLFVEWNQPKRRKNIYFFTSFLIISSWWMFKKSTVLIFDDVYNDVCINYNNKRIFIFSCVFAVINQNLYSFFDQTTLMILPFFKMNCWPNLVSVKVHIVFCV